VLPRIGQIQRQVWSIDDPGSQSFADQDEQDQRVAGISDPDGNTYEIVEVP
jgi:hypothetical protein